MVRIRHFLILASGVVGLAGCARWQSEGPGPVPLPEACPLRRAPAVHEFSQDGLRAVYHFVIQGASRADVSALFSGTTDRGFALMPLTVNINGRDSMFAHGPALLRSQRDIDAEFEIACRLGRGRVYMTHVRYNPARPEEENVRVR